MAKICQCCGQTLSPRLKLSVKLMPRAQKIIDRVHRAGPNGICSTDLFDYLYADDPNGGPESGMRSMYVSICRLNKRIKQDGLVLRAPVGGLGGHTNYVLEKLRGDHAKENHARSG